MQTRAIGFSLIAAGLVLVLLAAGTRVLDVPRQGPDTQYGDTEGNWEGVVSAQRHLSVFFLGVGITVVGIYVAKKQWTGGKTGTAR
jgi:hypothetical protein